MKHCFALCSSALLGLTTSALATSPYTVQFSAQDPALRCGSNITPTVTFANLPNGTKSLALIFWDRTSSGLKGRWAIRDLPTGSSPLSSAPALSSAPGGGKVSANQVGQVGFTAPCDKGRHDLYIDLYALNTDTLKVSPDIALRPLYKVIHQFKIEEATAHQVLVVR